MTDRGVEISEPIWEMLQANTQLLDDPSEGEWNVVVVIPTQPGFTRNITYQELWKVAAKYGLSCCPPQLALELRLQYMDQPEGGDIRVAMSPLFMHHSPSRVFALQHHQGRILLNSVEVIDGVPIDPNDWWLFLHHDQPKPQSEKFPLLATVTMGRENLRTGEQIMAAFAEAGVFFPEEKIMESFAKAGVDFPGEEHWLRNINLSAAEPVEVDFALFSLKMCGISRMTSFREVYIVAQSHGLGLFIYCV